MFRKLSGLSRYYRVLLTVGLVTTAAGCTIGPRWEPLFDGKTLNGWYICGQPGTWQVEDGILVGRLKKGDFHTFLTTERKFSNFELKLKMRYDSQEGNSGIFFRSDFPKPADENQPIDPIKKLKGRKLVWPQIEFAPPGSHTGGFYIAGGGGWVNKDKFTDQMQKLHKFHQWNDLRIKVAGDHVLSYLNGVVVTDEAGNPLPKEGSIALQLHSGPSMTVSFKDIYIRVIQNK
ncbi:MAG: DUF1080 domain-containing protein [Planctomycetota bacterium]|nr:MAG: DUF1080 domain-containing protein [Planctomycetota bacterium]